MSRVPRAERYEAFRDAILQRVCRVCLDQRDDGSCGLTGRECAIEGHLPALVEALVAVESDRLEDYEAAVRGQVCTTCDVPDATGRCALREHGDCALSAYLALVVDAVEEAQQSMAGRETSA
jgi:hypothetical protein